MNAACKHLPTLLGAIFLWMLTACTATPATAPGLTVLNVDSLALTSFPVFGHIAGVDEVSHEIFVIDTDDVLSKYSGMPKPSSKVELARLKATPDFGQDAFCRLSPTLKKVAFWGTAKLSPGFTDAEYGLWIADISGGGSAKRILEVGSGQGACLEWVSESDIVCAVTGLSQDNKYYNNILQINLDSPEPIVLFQGKIDLSVFALSPDRRRLAFYEEAPEHEKCVLKLLELESRTVSDILGPAHLGFDQLAWSPDGSRLALGDRQGLLILNLLDKSVVRANKDSNPFASLYFVTDDRLVALRCYEGRKDRLYVFDARKGEAIGYVHAANLFFTSVSLPRERVLVLDSGYSSAP